MNKKSERMTYGVVKGPRNVYHEGRYDVVDIVMGYGMDDVEMVCFEVLMTAVGRGHHHSLVIHLLIDVSDIFYVFVRYPYLFDWYSPQVSGLLTWCLMTWYSVEMMDSSQWELFFQTTSGL